MMRIARYVLVLALVASCSAEEAEGWSTPVVFVVQSDPGVGVPGATVFVGGAAVGVTDARGVVATEVDTRPGGHLRIEHRCPKGYLEESSPKLLRQVRSQWVGTRRLPIEVTLQCKPESRTAVFVIRADGALGLPVMLNGREMSRTNELGIAQFSVKGTPGTEYTVTLDTAAHPRLIPQFPVHHRTLDDAEEIFVLMQAFDTRQPRRKRRPRSPRITKIE